MRVGDALFIQDGHDRFHHVGGVFVDGVVAAAHKIRVRTVVIHSQPAAEIKVAHGGPFLGQSGVDPGAFHDGRADIADVGHL